MHLTSRLRFIGLLMAFPLFVSCQASKPQPPQITDSVVVEKTVVLRDTVFQAPSAATSLSVSMKEFSKGFKKPVSSQKGHATAILSQVGDRVRVDCLCDSVAIRAQLRDQYEQRLHKQTITQTPEQSYYTPWYMKALATVGGLSIVLLVAGIIYKTKRIV